MLEGGNESEDQVAINCLKLFYVREDNDEVKPSAAPEVWAANQGRLADLSEVANPYLLPAGGRFSASDL